MARLREDVIRYPWVFWVSISIRKEWFSYWWKTRGSNFIEFQVWIFKINIGMPWQKSPRMYYNKMNELRNMKKTNENCLKAPFSFLIGSYDKTEKRLEIN